MPLRASRICSAIHWVESVKELSGNAPFTAAFNVSDRQTNCHDLELPGCHPTWSCQVVTRITCTNSRARSWAYTRTYASTHSPFFYSGNNSGLPALWADLA